MNVIRLFPFIFFAFNSASLLAQDSDSTLHLSPPLPNNYYAKVDKKVNAINDQLTKKSLQYLTKFQKQELKLQKKLKKLNPEIFLENTNEQYAELLQKLKCKATKINNVVSGEYSPYIDSLGTSLSFLKQFKGISDKVNTPLSNLQSLQNNLQESGKIQKFIADRKNLLKETLSKYTHIPSDLKNQYSKLSKTAYYYSAQVKEYREMLGDPAKVEQKVLKILSKLPAFQQFWQKNSLWTKLFAAPANAGTQEALYGLQTREQLKADLLQKFGVATLRVTDNNSSGYLQQQLQQTQTQLYAIKNKLSKFGGASSLSMPDFQPNTQHTKTFLKRLQYAMSIQNSGSNRFLPAISTIGFNMGYKLNDKATVGIGMNYLLGFGNGINHIHLTNQGIGAKSFLDIKLKGSFWISGGIEGNYMKQFSRVQAIQNLKLWQKSALLGITKKYKVGKKEHNIQLLYDFLANKEIPAGQPFKYRIGFGF